MNIPGQIQGVCSSNFSKTPQIASKQLISLREFGATSVELDQETSAWLKNKIGDSETSDRGLVDVADFAHNLEEEFPHFEEDSEVSYRRRIPIVPNFALVNA